MAVQTRSPNFRSFAARSVTLAGLLVLAGVAAGAGPAHGECRNLHAQPGTSQSDPYPALKQAVDTYFAQRQKAEGFSGVSLHVSLSPRGPDYDAASGSTSFLHGQPISPDTLFQIGSITKEFHERDDSEAGGGGYTEYSRHAQQMAAEVSGVVLHHDRAVAEYDCADEPRLHWTD